MQFGELLRAERKKNNISAEVMAGACGVSRSYITLIETGKRLPSAKVIPKIAEALNLQTNIVLNWYLEGMKVKVEKSLSAD